MDLNSILFIIVGLIAIYLFIKLVVSPIVKAILAIVIFFVAVYLLQKYFSFNLLGLMETSFNKMIPGYDWIWGPINDFFNKIKLMLNI